MADTSNKNEQRNEHGFEWPVVVRNSNPHASLDYYYGPYDSVESMKSGVPAEVLVPGFTAAVQTDDGVTEYWVVSGSGSNATWEQKGLASDSLVRFKGTKATLDEVKAITDMQVGDMWLVPEDGVTDSSLEYVWTGEQWEQMGKTSSELTGTLSVTGADFTIDGTSKTTKTFNGTQNVTLDMSGFAASNDIGNGKLKIKEADSVYGGQTVENITTVFTANQSTDYTFDISSYATLSDVESTNTRLSELEVQFYTLMELLEGCLILKNGKIYYLYNTDNFAEDIIQKETGVELNTSKSSLTAKAFYESE